MRELVDLTTKLTVAGAGGFQGKAGALAKPPRDDCADSKEQHRDGAGPARPTTAWVVLDYLAVLRDQPASSGTRQHPM